MCYGGTVNIIHINCALGAIYSMNVLITFLVSYENIISECFLNFHNLQFLKCVKKCVILASHIQTLREHSILSVCKHCGNVTFESSPNILNVVTFEKNWNAQLKCCRKRSMDDV